MKKQTSLTFVLVVLALNTLELPLLIQPAKAENIIYIRPNGSVDPLTAPIRRNGNTYTLTNNIDVTITIETNNIVIEGNGFVQKGSGAGSGLTLDSTQNVTVRSMAITSYQQGIQLRGAFDTKIESNIITNCTYGILANESPSTTIAHNTLKNNEWDGIFITASPGVTLTNNTVTNNGKWGIYLGYSPNSKLRQNKMTDNKYNFGVSVDFNHDIDTSNTVNSKPIYYLVSEQNKQVPSNAGYVALINSYNINVQNTQLNNNGQGVLLVNSENNIIENANITDNGYYGIQIIGSRYNTIRNNTIANNYGGGLALTTSSGNTIFNNTIKKNENGIYFSASDNNLIYENNFINNTRQVLNQDSTNLWSLENPQTGNYWSDYTGLDTDGDGTGDTPYIIDMTNRDNFPLKSAVQKVTITNNNSDAVELTLLAIGLAILIIALTIYVKVRKSRIRK